MNIIFTDIDGVLNTTNRTEWNKTSIELYNKLCQEFNLKPVISSTWRYNHTKEELQKIFDQYGITTPIHDFTPILSGEGRGVEIETWLFDHSYTNFVILDDYVHDIVSCGLPNVVKCRGWVGFSQEDYDLARTLLLK